LCANILAVQGDGDDPRFGHALGGVQDESGADLLLLKQQLALTVEERFLRLEQHQEFVSELRGAANRR
jgi:hypothetical protein